MYRRRARPRSTVSGSDITSVSQSSYLTHSTSPSKLSTIYGIGSNTGKAIMMVGEFVIRGVETVVMRRRLSAIESNLLKHDFMSIASKDVDDLLELQRIGLYPREIRRKAMLLITSGLEWTETRNQMVEGLMRCPAIEVKHFLYQLMTFRPEEPSLDSRVSSSPQASMLRFLLENQPEVVHDIFDVNEFLVLLAAIKQSTSGMPGPVIPGKESLLMFLKQWERRTHPDEEVRLLQLFLDTGSRRDRKTFVDNVMEIPRSIINPIEDEIDVVLREDAVSDWDSSNSYLFFLLGLIRDRADLVPALANAGLINVIVKLLEILQQRRVPSTTEQLCHQVLGQLCVHVNGTAKFIWETSALSFLRTFGYYVKALHERTVTMVPDDKEPAHIFKCIYKLLRERPFRGLGFVAWRAILVEDFPWDAFVKVLFGLEMGTMIAQSVLRQLLEFQEPAAKASLPPDMRKQVQPCLAQVILAFLEAKPSIVAPKVGLDQVIFVLTEHQHTWNRYEKPLTVFFNILHDEYCERPRTRHTLPKIGELLVQYLRGAATETRKEVLKFILDFLKVQCVAPDLGYSAATTPDSSTATSHQVSTFLLFASSLMEGDEDSVRIFVQLDGLVPLGSLCRDAFALVQNPELYGVVDAFHLLRIVCWSRPQVLRLAPAARMIYMMPILASLTFIRDHATPEDWNFGLQYRRFLHSRSSRGFLTSGHARVLARFVQLSGPALERATDGPKFDDIAKSILFCYACLPEEYWSVFINDSLKNGDLNAIRDLLGEMPQYDYLTWRRYTNPSKWEPWLTQWQKAFCVPVPPRRPGFAARAVSNAVDRLLTFAERVRVAPSRNPAAEMQQEEVNCMIAEIVVGAQWDATVSFQDVGTL